MSTMAVRYLGLHLAEYKRKQEGGAWFGKHGKLAWLTSVQLAPIIVLYVTMLLVIFWCKVSESCSNTRRSRGRLLS